MTTQPTAKAQSALDWLCWVLIVFGGLCLVASLPQTFTMVRVAHDEFGSSILVVVLEVMAFFALLAPLWVPAWTKTFDRIAYTLLGITTLGNYAGGWNYVWTHNEMGPFWMSIRDWREPIFGLPLATILLVGTLSGLVPFAMKFFISLAIKRYRENELDRSPDAVAQRAIEPVLVQIIATQRLQERLLGLTSQFSNQPLVLPGRAPSLSDYSVEAEVQRILAEREAQRREGEQRHPFVADGLPLDDQREVWQAVRKAQVGVEQWQSDAATAQAEHIDRLMLDEESARWEEPGLYGGYTEKEMNCQGCFGPCGQCETDTQAATEASDEPEQPRVNGYEFLTGLVAALFTPPPDDGEPDDEEDEDDWEEARKEDAAQPDWDGAVEEPKTWTLEDIAQVAGRSVEELRSLVKRFGLNTPGKAWALLRSGGFGVPTGLTYAEFERLFAELVAAPADASVEATQEAAGIAEPGGLVDGMAGAAEPLLGASVGSSGGLECELCGEPAVNSDKAACKRGDWPKKLDGRLACKSCREKLR